MINMATEGIAKMPSGDVPFAETISSYHLTLIATNHSAVDYGLIAKHAALIVDTRGQYRGHYAGVIHA